MADPAPSDQDLYDLGKAEVIEARPDLRVEDWDVTDAILKAGAAMASAVIAWGAGQVRNLYFGGAEGEDLDTVIMDKLGLPRAKSQRSYGYLQFSRTVTGAAGSIPSGTAISTEPDLAGNRSTVTTDMLLSYPATTFTLTVPATAESYGSSSNVDVNLLTQPDSALPDANITVTNTQAFAGGRDSEADDSYATRARTLWQTQRRATLAALEQGALTVPSVAVARATDNELTGLVTLYVSDDDGYSNHRMKYDVELVMEEWRAAGIMVTVVMGSRAAVVIDLTVNEYSAGFDVEAAAQPISDAIVTCAARGKVGQKLTIDSIKAAAIAAYPTEIYRVTITSIQLTVGGVTTYPNATADIVAAGSLIRIAGVNVTDGGT